MDVPIMTTLSLILLVTVMDPIAMVLSMPSSGNNLAGRSIEGLRHIKHYLERFGYLSHTNSRHNNTTNVDDHDHNHDEDVFDDVLVSAIKKFQLNYGLPVTGEPDIRTTNQMSKPRCGVPDNAAHNNFTANGYHTDYKLMPGRMRWHKTKLRYKFLSSSRFPKVNYRGAVYRALRTWGRATDFRFKKQGSASAAELKIGFFSGGHGDGIPFDGPGKVLGHTFSPPVGITHFDADEPWTCSDQPGPERLDLESVALHELGHALGLDHSSDERAVMYPYFSYGLTKRKLYRDDIEGIRTLYGLP
ncbi:unnamed protein product [Linum trigynum]|uniref:Peptidase metallopeptidase domain-containing protein n=1 Tax=Linum trigynum TaxID=586398 RepID=A0AAV2DJU3_9ROSI